MSYSNNANTHQVRLFKHFHLDEKKGKTIINSLTFIEFKELSTKVLNGPIY